MSKGRCFAARAVVEDAPRRSDDSWARWKECIEEICGWSEPIASLEISILFCLYTSKGDSHKRNTLSSRARSNGSDWSDPSRNSSDRADSLSNVDTYSGNP